MKRTLLAFIFAVLSCSCATTHLCAKHPTAETLISFVGAEITNHDFLALVAQYRLWAETDGTYTSRDTAYWYGYKISTIYYLEIDERDFNCEFPLGLHGADTEDTVRRKLGEPAEDRSGADSAWTRQFLYRRMHKGLDVRVSFRDDRVISVAFIQDRKTKEMDPNKTGGR